MRRWCCGSADRSAELAPADVVGYLRGSRAPTVRSIVDNLRKAKVDPRVKAVLLKPTGFESPFWGKVQEVRDAVLDFRKSGKPVYAYLEYGGDREYYLATAADKVFLMPSTPLDLVGVATYELFLRGTLDKIGAYSRSASHRPVQDGGQHLHRKRATPPAHKEMDESMNRDLYEQIVRGIADGRKKNEADVRTLIDEGPFLPEDALARRAHRRSRVRGSGRRQAARRRAATPSRWRRLRARQPVVGRV